LNRRRFLKYAGATAAVVGASALGLEYSPTSPGAYHTMRETTTRTVTETSPGASTSSTSITRTSKEVSTTLFTTGSSTIFETDFANGGLERFWSIIDPLGIACNNLPLPVDNDFQVSIIEDTTAPTGHSRALQLITNVNDKPGICFNAIVATPAEFVDDSKYYAYGFFRKMPSKIELMTVNMQLTESFVGHDCAFAWWLNPYNPKYGWIVLRTKKSVEAGKWGENIHHLGDDTKWHYFEIEGTYRSNPKSRKITRLEIDATKYPRDDDMWTYSSGAESNFAVGLETANMYLNCDLNKKSQGISRLAKLGLVSIPT